MKQLELITDFAEKINCDYKKDVSMSLMTSFRTGGKAKIVLEPKNVACLKKMTQFLYQCNVKPFIIGNGSNLLISDKGIDGVVIHLGKGFDEIKLINSDTIECMSGCSLMRLCRFSLENELSGLEFAYGIPGSVGGAMYMNAGAYGGEMKDVVIKSEYINPDGSIDTYSREELNMSYRHSVFSDSDKIITSVTIQLSKAPKNEIESRMNELLQKRKDKQPLEYPSAGSTFKRPEGYFAGKLIEDCGLKGERYGGAEVSTKHSGFIINKDGATTDDILSLIKIVQNKVENKTGIMLETEVKIVGEKS